MVIRGVEEGALVVLLRRAFVRGFVLVCVVWTYVCFVRL